MELKSFYKWQMVEYTFYATLNIDQNTQKWENISQELPKGKIIMCNFYDE